MAKHDEVFVNLSVQFTEGTIEAGCDEAGRGCLAGPVVAAAVVLPEYTEIQGLNDSKKLNEKERYRLSEIIKEQALSYGIAAVSPQEIDNINILNASIKAMHLAIARLKVEPEFLAIDGNRFHPYRNIPYKCLVKGDARFKNIAAASILAKTFRDDYMAELHQKFPHYDWIQNKGYPTPTHKKAIYKYGICQEHRKSFSPNLSQYSLFDLM
jgi:ribonuclease HII